MIEKDTGPSRTQWIDKIGDKSVVVLSITHIHWGTVLEGALRPIQPRTLCMHACMYECFNNNRMKHREWLIMTQLWYHTRVIWIIKHRRTSPLVSASDSLSSLWCEVREVQSSSWWHASNARMLSTIIYINARTSLQMVHERIIELVKGKIDDRNKLTKQDANSMTLFGRTEWLCYHVLCQFEGVWGCAGGRGGGVLPCGHISSECIALVE